MSAEKVANLTGEILKGLLPDAVTGRNVGAPLDANELLAGGVYTLDRSDLEDSTLRLNYPTSTNRAIIIVFQRSGFIVQLYVQWSGDRGETYIRIRWSSAGWSGWKKLT